MLLLNAAGNDRSLTPSLTGSKVKYALPQEEMINEMIRGWGWQA